MRVLGLGAGHFRPVPRPEARWHNRDRTGTWTPTKMNYYLTLVLDWLASILTVVLVLVSIVLRAVIWRPQIRRRLAFPLGPAYGCSKSLPAIL